MDAFRRWAGRTDRAVVFTVALALAFGLFFVRATPLLWGADEATHMARVYQISHGHIRAQFLGTTGGTGYGGQVPIGLAELNYVVQGDESDAKRSPLTGSGDVSDPAAYSRFNDTSINDRTVVMSFPNTAAYSPVAYAPAIVGMWLARAGDMSLPDSIYTVRIAGLFAYALLAAGAVYVLRGSRARWLIASVALLPMAVFQGSIITADTMTIGVILLFASFIIKTVLLRKQLRVTEKVLLAVCGVLLPLLKPNYALLLPVLFMIPRSTLGGRRPAAWLRWGVVGVALALLAAWLHLVSGVSEAAGLIRGDVWQEVSQAEQLRYLMHQPVAFVAALVRTLLMNDIGYSLYGIGLLGATGIVVPATAMIASLLAVFTAVQTSEAPANGSSRRIQIGLWLVLAANVLAVFGTLYLTFSRVGFPVIEGVQPRYFLPLYPFGLVAAVLLLRQFKPSVFHANVISGRFIAVCITGSLILSALKFHYVIW